MAGQPHSLDRLIDGIYAAAFNERDWHDVVRDLETAFGGPGASIIDVDVTNGTVCNMITNQLAPRQDDYVDRMNAINPRMKRALAQPGPHVAVDYDGLPEQAIRRHEFYDWLEKECGVKYFIGARMLDQPPNMSFVSVEFTARHGHASEGEVALFRRLAPHVANAWRLAGKIDTLRAEAAAATRVVARSQVGMFGLDATGAIVSASAAAERIVRVNDGLHTLAGRLHADQAATNRGLQIALGAALRCARSQGNQARTVIVVPRPSRRRDYIVEISACANRHGRQPHGVPVVFVFVSDPEDRTIDQDILRSLYGLTVREAQLTAVLQDGRALGDAAGELGMARNTARVHLASVLQKTGCGSRPELVALLGCLQPFSN